MYGWWLEELPQDIHCKFKVIGQSINEVIFDTPTTSLIVLMWERTYPCPVSLGILSLWQGIRLHGRYGESLLPQVLGRCLLCIQKHLWTWSDHKGQYWTPICPAIECTWGPEYARYWRLLNICKPGTLWENILWKIHFQISPQRRKFCLWRSSLRSSSTVASLQTSILNDVISVHLRKLLLERCQ